MENKENVMIDIETLGTSFDSVMLSCSLVKFDITNGKTYEELTVYFDLEESIKKGFKVKADTLEWWLTQNPEVLRGQIKKTSSYASLLKICAFLGDKDCRVWGNSASFDLGILGNYCDLYLVPRPWKFWNEMCVRTICNINPEPKINMDFVGEKHNPIDDCKHQVKYLVETLKSFKHGK